jgi:hypothetical protein
LSRFGLAFMILSRTALGVLLHLLGYACTVGRRRCPLPERMRG